MQQPRQTGNPKVCSFNGDDDEAHPLPHDSGPVQPKQRLGIF
jgi:hypothetical protein